MLDQYNPSISITHTDIGHCMFRLVTPCYSLLQLFHRWDMHEGAMLDQYHPSISIPHTLTLAIACFDLLRLVTACYSCFIGGTSNEGAMLDQFNPLISIKHTDIGCCMFRLVTPCYSLLQLRFHRWDMKRGRYASSVSSFDIHHTH